MRQQGGVRGDVAHAARGQRLGGRVSGKSDAVVSVRAPATGTKDDALTVEARHLNDDRAVQVVEMTDLALTEQDLGPVAGAICGEHDVRLPSGTRKNSGGVADYRKLSARLSA